MAACTSLALVAPWTTGVASAADTAQRSRGAAAGALATLQVEAKGVDVNPAGKGGWRTAKDGQSLKAGDAVRTDGTGLAQIAYEDGSLTRLDVDTEYKLVKLSAKKGDRKTKGLQTAGQTWHRVEKLADDDSYKVEGANATAAVLGTAFVVTCVARNQCTFTAVVDPIQLTDPGQRNGTKTVTLTPGDQAVVVDDAIGPVTTLTQEELLAIQWIVENLLADEAEGKSPGTSEIADQPDPPPTRVPSSPVQDPPPPAPPADTGTGTGTGSGDETPANQGPTAADDAYSMPEDTLLAIAAPGVLGNDSDPEGSALTLFLTSQPTHGSLLVFGDGGFVYVPDTNFSGTDTWTYVAGDGEFGSNVATVFISVEAGKVECTVDAPSIEAEAETTTPAQGEYVSILVHTYYDSPYACDLGISVSTQATAPHGHVVAPEGPSCEGSWCEWEFAWDPEQNGAAMATITFTAWNGVYTEIATVVLDYQSAGSTTTSTTGIAAALSTDDVETTSIEVVE